MPANKNQHYVPKCYLKPFTVDSYGKCINLYNISNNRFVSNAPVKSQCAKDYFYGKDLGLEKVLQCFEGEYARILCITINKHQLTKADFSFLKIFCYLQYWRTKAAIEQAALKGEKTKEYITRLYGENSKEAIDEMFGNNIDYMTYSMKMWFDTRESIQDLKCCLIYNNSKSEFITSDDPAIFTNRFHIQRLQDNTFWIRFIRCLIFSAFNS